jgi:hypothetical protein
VTFEAPPPGCSVCGSKPGYGCAEFRHDYAPSPAQPTRDDKTLALAEEYRAACAAIGPAHDAREVKDMHLGDAERYRRVRAYHEAINRAGNARRALLEHASADTPEVAPT